MIMKSMENINDGFVYWNTPRHQDIVSVALCVYCIHVTYTSRVVHLFQWIDFVSPT